MISPSPSMGEGRDGRDSLTRRRGNLRRGRDLMRCAVIKRYGDDVGNLVIEERPDLRAEGENIRVRVAATALNRADLLQRRGLYDPPPWAPRDIPGLEFVGEVDQVGDAVSSWKGGERVMGLVAGGAYAEQLVTHERAVVAVSRNLSDTDAAAVPEAFITAYDALVCQGGMSSGDLVLVHAVAGGVGSAAVQLVHLLGAVAVGTAGSDEKLEKIARLAPFFPVNYRKVDLRKAVEEAFGPRSVDLVLDVVGAAYWERNIALLADRGTLVLVGLLGGSAAGTPLAEILRRRLRIMGTVLRSRPLEEKIAVARDFAHAVLPHLSSGRLRPVVDSVFPFEQLHAATMRMERNENTGKIVLEM